MRWAAAASIPALVAIALAALDREVLYWPVIFSACLGLAASIAVGLAAAAVRKSSTGGG